MHDVLSFRVCIYVYMYVCMYICMYNVYPSQSIQDTSIVQFPLFNSMKSNRTRSYSVTRSHSVSAKHTKFSQHASHSAHCICLLALSHHIQARRDSVILVYIICSAWPGPFSHPLGEGKGSTHGKAKFGVDCKASSYALCKDKEALCYTKVHRSGAQLCFQIRQQRGTS